jgi:hypothetical protein
MRGGLGYCSVAEKGGYSMHTACGSGLALTIPRKATIRNVTLDKMQATPGPARM